MHEWTRYRERVIDNVRESGPTILALATHDCKPESEVGRAPSGILRERGDWKVTECSCDPLLREMELESDRVL